MADVAEKRQFSCYQCRARKLKCNREWPCQKCSELGEECRFPESRQRPGHVQKRPKVKDLQGRLTDLEHRFRQQHSSGQPPAAQEYTDIIPTGRLEQLPPQSVVDELTSFYFSQQHSEAPMQDPSRYLASLHRPPHLQPPICLQYTILAIAASLSPAHKELALPFYHRARNYIEHDEMKADGHHVMTLGHAQCWVLLGHFEAKHLWFARASLSVSRSVRLAQMLGLYDVEAVNASFSLAPSDDWQEKEERRRTMWTIFCSDRLSSSTTGWHPLVDVDHVRTLLPASEEAFQLGTEETSLTLREALGNASARLSSFACRVLVAHIFYACLEHTFRRYPDDDAENPQESEFWKRQQSLDNSLATLFVALPDSLRCPEDLARRDAVFINLTLHTASICIHRVGLVRAKGTSTYAGQSQGAAVRVLAAAEAIFAIINSISDPDVLFSNPFVAFAAYMAALVFLDDFGLTHSQHSEDCLNALMNLMVRIANENLVTASLALQLAGHLKKSGIDASALDKVKHLAAKVESDAFVTGLQNDHTATVLFCPFQPRPVDGM